MPFGDKFQTGRTDCDKRDQINSGYESLCDCLGALDEKCYDPRTGSETGAGAAWLQFQLTSLCTRVTTNRRAR